MEETISDVFAGATPRRHAPPRAVLYVVFHVDNPAVAPSRHLLDDIEVVCFGRGPRGAVRRSIDGKPGLVIHVPDPAMSSAHGQLIRDHDTWRLEDPLSKNGAVVDGRPMRLSRIAPGAVVQLGHTIFLFDRTRLPDTAPMDVVADPREPPLADLVTLDARLGGHVAELERIATTDVPVLVLGETGTGKEVIARAIHASSHRPGPLVAVNCGAISSTLLESELFGHRKGAFSGAVSDRLGHLRAADHGTLFLDEVGELSPAAQVALLRALQQREVVPVGESLPVPVDVRIVAATHRDLAAMCQQDRFREDLHSRLLGVTIRLPPLRERRFDLGILIRTLLQRIDRSGRARLTPAAARALFAHTWPRNVRELERALAGALARCEAGLIDVEHLPDEIAACVDREDAAPLQPVPHGAAADNAVDDALRSEIVDALIRHGGNVTAAAKSLGKHREQLHRWARRFGIDLESFRR